MKKYGIYLAYPPGLDLRKDGLGRFLTSFLSAALQRQEARFVVACPSWTQADILEMLRDIGAGEKIEVLSPRRMPLLLRLERYYRERKKDPKKPGWIKLVGDALEWALSWTLVGFESIVVNLRNPFLAALVLVMALPFLFLAVLWKLALVLPRALGRRTARLSGRAGFQAYFSRLRRMVERPRHDRTVSELFRLMEKGETDLVLRMIEARKDVAAWYCPTAFWPSFNRIDRPRLMTVPDVVMGEFPAAFSGIQGGKMLAHFQKVESSIRGASHLVTYSQRIKQSVLVDRYFVPPDLVSVVPHGAMRLDGLVMVSGFTNNDEATDQYCRTLLRFALCKALENPLVALFGKGRVKFLFYASQFRPNKNVLTLLRAYEHLLRRRFIGHKLLLTGNPQDAPEVGRFVRERGLENDVLYLNGLSDPELAACYRLADLAVNPSLSEGGCPFTLTEALSVGTPVVMGRIAVTEETVTDPVLREKMLFDPYDRKDMADRIEWALKNREELLSLQRPLYETLCQRTWETVVGDHIGILDRISGNAASEKGVEHGA